MSYEFVPPWLTLILAFVCLCVFFFLFTKHMCVCVQMYMTRANVDISLKGTENLNKYYTLCTLAYQIYTYIY